MNRDRTSALSPEAQERLSSLPTSVRTMLEKAYPASSSHERAEMTQAIIEMARSNPEIAAMIIAATQLGATGLSRMRTEERHYFERRTRSILGLSLQDEIVPLTEVRRTTETWRLT